MRTEQAQKGNDDLIANNGFTIAPGYDKSPDPIYHRVWQKQGNALEIRICLSHSTTLVCVKRNNQVESGLVRDYANPKIAMNAIRQIVKCAGFEM